MLDSIMFIADTLRLRWPTCCLNLTIIYQHVTNSLCYLRQKGVQSRVLSPTVRASTYKSFHCIAFIVSLLSGANIVEDASGRMIMLDRLSELRRKGLAARLLSTPGQKVPDVNLLTSTRMWHTVVPRNLGSQGILRFLGALVFFLTCFKASHSRDILEGVETSP